MHASDNGLELPVSLACLLCRNLVSRFLQFCCPPLRLPQLNVGQRLLVKRPHDSELALLKSICLCWRALLDLLGESVEVIHDDLVVSLQVFDLQLDLCVFLPVVLQLLVLLS